MTWLTVPIFSWLDGVGMAFYRAKILSLGNGFGITNKIV